MEFGLNEFVCGRWNIAISADLWRWFAGIRRTGSLATNDGHLVRVVLRAHSRPLRCILWQLSSAYGRRWSDSYKSSIFKLECALPQSAVESMESVELANSLILADKPYRTGRYLTVVHEDVVHQFFGLRGRFLPWPVIASAFDKFLWKRRMKLMGSKSVSVASCLSLCDLSLSLSRFFSPAKKS